MSRFRFRSAVPRLLAVLAKSSSWSCQSTFVSQSTLILSYVSLFLMSFKTRSRGKIKVDLGRYFCPFSCIIQVTHTPHFHVQCNKLLFHMQSESYHLNWILHKVHLAKQNSLSWIHGAVENYVIFGHPVENQVIWVELNMKRRIKNVLKFRELLV